MPDDSITRKRKNVIIILAVMLVIIFVVIGLLIILFNKKTGFKISNEGQYLKDVKQADKDVLMSVLANQIKNVSDIDVEKNLVEGSIRDGSYSENTQDGVTVSKFLLDIDAIKQTYTVEFPWSRSDDVPDGISVECPPNSQSKFPDSYCIGTYTTSASIGIYLPYDGNINGSKYSVYANYLVENGLDLFVTACGDENLMDMAKKNFENWIDNTNFLENIYTINLVDICTQFSQ